MPTCIYCREEKLSSAFNREHVIPQSFGRFEQNLVLHDTVCAICNSYFDKHLDLRLARDSIEGLKRYELDVRRPEEGTAFGRGQLLKATINDGSFYDGAQVWWGPSDDGRRLVLHPFPQLQITNERDVRRWFPLEDFPSRTELSAFGFQPGEPIVIKPFGVEGDAATRLLVEKGYEVSAFEEAPSSEQGPDVGIRISGAIDRTLMRAVARSPSITSPTSTDPSR